MAISINPAASIIPAYLPPISPPLASDQPDIQPVGFNQRSAFIGAPNALEQAGESVPSGLRTFTQPATAPLSETETSNDLFPSLTELANANNGTQLDLFGSSRLDAQSGDLFSASGLSDYASVQAGNFQPFGSPSLSIFA